MQAQQVSQSAGRETEAPGPLFDAHSSNAMPGVDERFRSLDEKLRKLEGDPSKNWDDFEQGARELIKKLPARPEGYHYMMLTIEYGKLDRARLLAKEIVDSAAPERYKAWAKGFLNRVESLGKPIALQSVALSGQEVNLTKMRGRVVLICFWGSGCVPSTLIFT